jgi:hypothetical protein
MFFQQTCGTNVESLSSSVARSRTHTTRSLVAHRSTVCPFATSAARRSETKNPRCLACTWRRINGRGWPQPTIIRTQAKRTHGSGAPGRTTGRDVGRGPQNVHAAGTKGPFRSFLPRPSVAQTATGSQEHPYASPLPSRRGRAGDVRGGH